MTTVITHPGQAHADEVIAIAILLTKLGVTQIIRRQPTEDELNDPDTWVIDVGGRYEPDRRNFDHHNVPGNENDCSFDLILDHFNLSVAARAASPWLAFKSSIDCYGPYATASKFGMDPETLFATISPIESQVLQLFAEAQEIKPGDFLYQLMEMVGRGLVDYWTKFAYQLELAYKATTIEADDLLFVDYRSVGSLGAGVMSKHMTDIRAAGSIVTDDRDPGAEDRVVLYRHKDHPRVDFRRLNADEMHFVHHNGFIAKTKDGDTTDDRIVELLEQAVLPVRADLIDGLEFVKPQRLGHLTGRRIESVELFSGGTRIWLDEGDYVHANRSDLIGDKDTRMLLGDFDQVIGKPLKVVLRDDKGQFRSKAVQTVLFVTEDDNSAALLTIKGDSEKFWKLTAISDRQKHEEQVQKIEAMSLKAEAIPLE
jgi:hypothetical protein